MTVILPSRTDIQTALHQVHDPEIHQPIDDLGMVKDIAISPDGAVTITINLTVAHCPLKDTLIQSIRAAVGPVAHVADMNVIFGVMSDDQRQQLVTRLRGGSAQPVISFAQPDSTTRVFAIASGKGGVGKSSVTVNLAAALTRRGLRVGIIDADIHGFSIPRMLGVTGHPTPVGKMILPPVAQGISVMSIGMFIPKGNVPVVWRGPMLHRALQQFMADAYWGQPDIMLLDLPPGTGDIAISVAQLVPNAEIIVVTTPQSAAAEVAERAGSISVQTHQKVVGVIENMSWLETEPGQRLEIFGSGGGALVSQALTDALGTAVPLLGQIPLDMTIREGGDAGIPSVTGHPDTPASMVFTAIADRLAVRSESLVGRSLPLSVS